MKGYVSFKSRLKLEHLQKYVLGRTSYTASHRKIHKSMNGVKIKKQIDIRRQYNGCANIPGGKSKEGDLTQAKEGFPYFCMSESSEEKMDPDRSGSKSRIVEKR